MQFFPIRLPTLVYTPSGIQVTNLRDLPATMFGRIVHVVGFLFDVGLIPTLTGPATLLPKEANFVVKKLTFNDGAFNRFRGGFNHLRVIEYLSTGRVRLPDPNATATAIPMSFRRFLPVGPVNFVGGLDEGGTDYALPAAQLRNAQLSWEFGALADMDPALTALTGIIRVSAICTVLDEVRIAPLHQWDTQDLNSSDQTIVGNAVYTMLALARNSLFQPFSSPGDLGNLTLNPGNGDVLASVPATTVDAVAHALYGAGQFTQLRGTFNLFEATGKATANDTIVDADPIIQSVVITPKAAKLSKCMRAEAGVRLQWDGPLTSAHCLYGRVLDQPPPVVTATTAQVLTVLGREISDAKIKTISKVAYNGPLQNFMPVKVGVKMSSP